jgi:hypothetical protein
VYVFQTFVVVVEFLSFVAWVCLLYISCVWVSEDFEYVFDVCVLLDLELLSSPYELEPCDEEPKLYELEPLSEDPELES